jgi:transcription initiation factor IIF auxiliary subunit
MADEFMIQQWENYEGEEGEDWWKWAVWVEGNDRALDRIDFVEWTLHPTFPNPIRRIYDRSSKFRLDTGGWGVFRIVARVQLKNGQQEKLSHYLKLHYPDGRQTTA